MNANINTEKRYLLEGHTLPKNDPNYLRLKNRLLDEYAKVIDYLTFDKSFILEKQLEEKTEKLSEVDLIDRRHKEDVRLLQQENKQLQDTIAQLTKDVGKIQKDIETFNNPPPMTLEEMTAFVEEGKVSPQWLAEARKKKKQDESD